MVKRRKVLIGAGSLLAGGAAATGTGAFSQASTGKRAVEVQTESDETAYIAFSAGEFADNEGSGIVEFDGNKMKLDIGADGNGANAWGVNEDSTYYWDNLFNIELEGSSNANINEGTNDAAEYDISVYSSDGLLFYTGEDGSRSGPVRNEKLVTDDGHGESPAEISIGLRVEEDQLANDLWLRVEATRVDDD